MRKIKFRGKRIDNGKWVYGSLMKSLVGKKYIIELVDDVGAWQPDFRLLYAEVDPSTVGQYTGLKDKNGVKIFEGDVLIFDGDKFVISWDDERCGFRMDYWMFDEQYDLSEFWPTSEIIGNIHDNPEMLGSDDDLHYCPTCGQRLK